MRKGNHGRTMLILALVLTISGCMHLQMVPMKIGQGMDQPETIPDSPTGDVSDSRTLEIFDRLIEELLTDLSSKQRDIAIVAVWGLNTRPEEEYRETVRQKLITRLIASQAFTVVTRERLQALLKEQGLSETGIINEEATEEIGAMIGVDGFIDGYLSISRGLYVLSLSLIDAKSGEIIWAKTAERMAH